MPLSSSPRESRPAKPKGFFGVIESKKPRRWAFADYRQYIRNYYDGFAGKLTGFTGLVTGHETLAGRLIRPGAFLSCLARTRGASAVAPFAGWRVGNASRSLCRRVDTGAAGRRIISAPLRGHRRCVVAERAARV